MSAADGRLEIGSSAPRPGEPELTAVTAHGWRVTDGRLPRHHPSWLLAFIEQRGDVFEVMRLGAGFAWHECASLEAAVAFVLGTAVLPPSTPAVRIDQGRPSTPRPPGGRRHVTSVVDGVRLAALGQRLTDEIRGLTGVSVVLRSPHGPAPRSEAASVRLAEHDGVVDAAVAIGVDQLVPARWTAETVSAFVRSELDLAGYGIGTVRVQVALVE